MTSISRAIITGGREAGGLQSFAVTLAEGFTELGIPAEVIAPTALFRRWRDLRNQSILKILSTSAAFAAPVARRTICMAHGFPRVDAQGWLKVLAIISSFKINTRVANSCLVAVSEYSASHLKAFYRVVPDAVIHNPLNSVFLEPFEPAPQRPYITYVGRLHPVKRVERLLPVMQAVLDESPGLEARIVGDGILSKQLRAQFASDPHIVFTGDLDALAVRAILRKTLVFVSGCETEAFGIAYLEALSQGCSVVMPACGGGLEIAPELVGGRIQLMPLSNDPDSIKRAIHLAMESSGRATSLEKYSSKSVALEYLRLAASC